MRGGLGDVAAVVQDVLHLADCQICTHAPRVGCTAALFLFPLRWSAAHPRTLFTCAKLFTHACL